MSITIIVELSIKPEMADAYIGRLTQALTETRAYAGCDAITAYRSDEATNEVLLVERWESREHYDRYIAWRRSTGTFDRLATLLLRPMSVRYFHDAA